MKKLSAMAKRNKILGLALILFLARRYGWGCTGFSMRDGRRVLACLSFDFQFGAGHIYVNQRNVLRRRYLLYAEAPVRWVSRYGSVTFNLAGVNSPHDGMNEAGLVVLSMGLDATKFPQPDNRPAIDELGWVQYQLDNSASVADVIENMKKVRISSRSIGDSHFLIIDRSGESAVVEYLNGREVMTTGRDLPYAILANDTYPRLLAYLDKQKELGAGRTDALRVGSSLSRFAHVAGRLGAYDGSGEKAVDFAFAVLSDVRQSHSQYQVVYDAESLSVAYRSFNSSDIKTMAFSELSFDCRAPVLMADIQSPFKGDIVDRFYEYDAGRCRTALIEFNKQTFEYLPEAVLSEMAASSLLSDCLGEGGSSLPAGKQDTEKDVARPGGLVAFLRKPAEAVVAITARGGDNIVAAFGVELNRASRRDLDLGLEVPGDSDLVPGDNVFITPNPVRIARGARAAIVKAIIISDRIRRGAEGRLVINLVSGDVPVGRDQQFVIHFKREKRPG
jgi:Linear amide C-N hydrolases, choloylglycine hydrolase family